MQKASVSQQKSYAACRPGARLAWIGQGLLLLAVGAVIVLIRDLFDNPLLFAQIVLSGLQLGFVYAMIALGYTMVYGIVKLINFAHGDVFMVGAFVSFYAVARFSLHLWPTKLFLRCRTWLAVIIGSITVMLLSMLICVTLAVVIERVAYKPLRDAPRIAALITAIGVSFFLEFFGALNFVFSPRFIPYQRPFDVVVWYIGAGGIHACRRAYRRRPTAHFLQHLSDHHGGVDGGAGAAAVPGAPHQDGQSDARDVRLISRLHG